MMGLKKAKNLHMFVMFLIPLTLLAQDYRFSQYYNAPLLLNPANTGNIENDFRFQANYKNQWSSISNAYKTSAGSFDMPMFEDFAGISKLGFGISFLSDKAGTTNYGFTNINTSLAYHLKTNRYTKISAGLLLGYGQSSADLSNVRWENQHNGNNYDPSAASGESAFVNQIRYFEAGTGILLNSYNPDMDRVYEIGLSVLHANFPNHSFIGQYQDRLRPKIQLHGGIDYGYEKFILRPRLQLQKQGPSYYANLGSLFSFRLGGRDDSRFTDAYISSTLDLGIFYRFRESIMVTAQFDYKKHLLIALSYDFNTSALATISAAGGYEISLRYTGMFRNEKFRIKSKMNKEEKDRPKSKDKKSKPNIRM